MFVLTALIANSDVEHPFVCLLGVYDSFDEARRNMRLRYSDEIRRAVEDGWIDDVLNCGQGDRRERLHIDDSEAMVTTDYRHYELNIFDSSTNRLARR